MRPWDERNREFWESVSEHWIDESDTMFETGPRAEMLSFACQRFGQGAARILDFGCGPGASTARLAAQGYEAEGCDISPKMVEAATARGLSVRLIDGVTLPWPENRFDGVFACTSLEWSDQPHLLIKEIARVLNPGGALVAITLGPWLPPRMAAYPRLYGKPTHHNMMMPWELHKLLTEHNFAVEEMHGVYPRAVTPEVLAPLEKQWQLRASLAVLWGISARRS